MNNLFLKFISAWNNIMHHSRRFRLSYLGEHPAKVV